MANLVDCTPAQPYIVVGSHSSIDRQSLWILVAASFLCFLGIGSVTAQLALHVTNEFKSSPAIVGAVLAAMHIAALSSRIFGGKIADRWGRRPVVFCGITCCALAGVMYVLPIGIASAYCGRVLQGIGEAALFTSGTAWAVELAKANRGGRALSHLGGASWGGLTIGTVSALAKWISFQQTAILGAVIAGIALVMLLNTKENHITKSNLPGTALSREAVVAAGLTFGFVHITFATMMFVAPHINSRTLNEGLGYRAFFAYTVAILVARFILGSLPDRQPRFTFYTGIFLMTVGLLVLATSSDHFLIIAGSAITGLGSAFPGVVITSTVLRRTDDVSKGRTAGIIFIFWDAFMAGASLLQGNLANSFHSYSVIFIVAAFALVPAAVLGKFVLDGVAAKS